ncbi:hypothetical protein [Streptomyces sp. NRRL S-1813]|uniref:hypothetical protein n=1 Tax=Streptomyces sp. NRRL S-1813 TaxID=1463888 RepID=UPI0004C524F9|nr:hypothetical protein [Streptomyces sp. NRRL S-1813]
MADQTEWGRRLHELTESSRRRVVAAPAERVRARGDQRRRRKRVAATAGGAFLPVALAVGGAGLLSMPSSSTPDPAEVTPAPTASAFTTPTPVPGEEYASELGYVYGAVTEGGKVRITVKQLRELRGDAASAYARAHGLTAPADGEALAVDTGTVHTLTLPAWTPVEAHELSGNRATDMRLGQLVGELRSRPKWTFWIDYDTRHQVASLREVGQRPDRGVTRS